MCLRVISMAWVRLYKGGNRYREVLLTDVSAGHLDSLGPVHVGQESEAEPLSVAWIGESVDGERGLRRVERLPYPRVQLIVRYTTPERRLRVRHRLNVYNTQRYKNG